MLCPACFTNQGITTSQGNLLPCLECRARQDKLDSPNLPVEIIPEYIKAERKERQDSIEQPHFKGELNKRWVDLWGKQAARDKGFSEKEIENAEYVYDGTPLNYYKEQT
jgi:hypothetical protein